MAVAVAMRSAKLPVAAAAAADVATKTAAQIGGPTADTSWNKWLPEPFFHIFLCFFHVFSQIEESFGSEGSSDGAFGEHVGVCGRAFRGLRALGMHRDAKKTVVPSCYMTINDYIIMDHMIICDSRGAAPGVPDLLLQEVPILPLPERRRQLPDASPN